MNEQLKIKPVLDTSILQKQLDTEAPRLKLNIDTSHFSEQIQSAVGNLNIQPIQVPVRLSVSEKELQGAVTPALNAGGMYGINAAKQQFPTAGYLPSNPSGTSSVSGSSSGSFKNILNAGTELLNTYNSLSNISRTVTGMVGSAGSNFSKSFD